MIYRAVICILISMFAFAGLKAEVVAQSETLAWTWPVDSPFEIREHTVDSTTIENVGFGVRNLDITYRTPERLNCLKSGRHRQYHGGVDIYNPNGTMKNSPVYAVANGKVIYAGGNYPGIAVIIKHEIYGEPVVYSVYMHLEFDSVPPEFMGASPSEPISVIKGNEIGTILSGDDENNNQDYDGRFPDELHVDGNLDDSHLHFEIRSFGIEQLYSNCPGTEVIAAGLGYTYPETPEEMGYLDPIQFLSARINTNHVYLPQINGDATGVSASSISTCVTGSNLLAMSGFDEAGPPYRPWFEISSVYGATLEDDSTLQYYPFVATDHPTASDPPPVRSSPQAAMYNVPLDTNDAITQRDEELLQSFVVPLGAIGVGVSFYFKFWGKILGMDPDDRILFELTEARTGRPLWRDEIDKDALEQDTWYNRSVAATPITAGQRYSMRMSLLTYEDGGIIDVRDTYMAIDDVQVIVQCG